MAGETEHELLLRHFSSWAAAKKRDVDVDLVGTLLELRSSYDELPATYWPAGSIEDLLLRLWPAKGDVVPPDADTVAASLDGYVRFLRGTGRHRRPAASAACEIPVRDAPRPQDSGAGR